MSQKKNKYKFRYRLSKKSSFEAIVKAVREMNMDLTIRWDRIRISWEHESIIHARTIYETKELRDEDVAEWLNSKLEERELLAPEEPEP